MTLTWEDIEVIYQIWGTLKLLSIKDVIVV